jgi:hypothetical protein
MSEAEQDPILVTIDVSRIRYDLGEIVRERVKESVDEHLQKLVESEVAGVATEVVRDKIQVAAAEVFATGWTKTDEYGRPSEIKKTVRDMILEHLTARDTYSSRGTWMEKMLNEHLASTIRVSVQPEIDAAKKMFKEMLDGSIRDKLSTALREAMGLK